MRFSTRLILASLLGLAGVATNVDAHSKLVSPTAWNAQPSKSNTCGVGANANAANPANFRKTVLGNTVEIKWDVVIGDGRGPITAKLDTTAKVNPTVRDFTVDLQATTTNLQPRVGSYTVTFTIPNNIQCTGPDNTCTMRVASSSNWVACATIQLQGQLPQPATQPPPVVTQPPPVVTEAPTEPSTPTNPATDPPATDPVTQPPPAVTDAPATDPPVTAAPTTPTTPTPIRDPTEYYPYASKLNTCQIATNLKICTNINGQSIQLMGVDLATVESQAIEQIDLNLLNPSVLERPNTDGCLEALTDMICAQMFPPCRSDSTVVCTSTCQRVNNLCKPNATEIIDDQGGRSSHAELFDCNNINLGFTEINADSTGNCPAVDTGIRPTQTQTTTKAPGTGTTTAPGTTRKPVSLSSTGPGRNHASSLKSSFTVVMGVVTLLLAFVVPV